VTGVEPTTTRTTTGALPTEGAAADELLAMSWSLMLRCSLAWTSSANACWSLSLWRSIKLPWAWPASWAGRYRPGQAGLLPQGGVGDGPLCQPGVMHRLVRNH